MRRGFPPVHDGGTWRRPNRTRRRASEGNRGIWDMVYAVIDRFSPWDVAGGGRHGSKAPRTGAERETPAETRDDVPDSLEDGLVGLMFGD